MESTELELDLTGDSSLDLSLGEAFPIFVTDYNLLTNKPRIEGVELAGNISAADLFSGGLILDGGTSEGAEFT